MAFPTEKKFVREKGHIILPISGVEIPGFVRGEADKARLVEKPEYHISVAVTKNSKRILDALAGASDPNSFWEEIVSLVNEFSWEYELLDKYYLLENKYDREELLESGYKDLTEHTRRTIVQEAKLTDIESFYDKLSNLLNISFDIPVPHITLFSWSDYPPLMSRGIGICSKQEFDKYTVREIVKP
ncbi:hypothetical protein KKH05_00330 [Patescibacteria group bacterium]|nr:hypothetical protein [Patescibacteria group bacterium]